MSRLARHIHTKPTFEARPRGGKEVYSGKEVYREADLLVLLDYWGVCKVCCRGVDTVYAGGAVLGVFGG